MKKAIIFSRNNFPNKDAGAVRDYSFARIYKKLGYQVYVICLGDKEKGLFNGIEFQSIKKEKNTFFSRLKSEFGYKRRMIQTLSLIINEDNKLTNNILFHVVDIPINAFIYLKKMAKKRSYIIVHDSVEWYSPSNFKTGIFHHGYISKNILNRYVVNREVNVYSISKYLDSYYKSKGINSLKIPVILDLEDSFEEKVFNKDNTVKFIYAGSPARKDDLNTVISVFYKLNLQFLKKVKLNIYGIEKEDYINRFPKLRKEVCYLVENESLIFYGRVNRTRIKEEYHKADYSILVRPSNKRYSKAGFPTKVVESLSLGTPVVCNLTSDLDLYLKDGYNSYVSKDESVSKLIEVIQKSILNPPSSKMNQNCIDSANKYFNYKNYIESIKDFLDNRG